MHCMVLFGHKHFSFTNCKQSPLLHSAGAASEEKPPVMSFPEFSHQLAWIKMKKLDTVGD